MMIYVSVVQLLNSLRAFVQGDVRCSATSVFDTSFKLVVRRNKEGLSVAGENGVIAQTTAPELASAVLHAAQALGRSLPPEDTFRFDWENAIADFRPLVPSRKG
ncbi:hypothetical protein [Streptomyces sp. NPDC007205]|uniref:hypothetical protein n=1 Tax=Streptomyces sp. NPDC007205 TaxID=3154316 RepID=UPI0033EF5B44